MSKCLNCNDISQSLNTTVRERISKTCYVRLADYLTACPSVCNVLNDKPQQKKKQNQRQQNKEEKYDAVTSLNTTTKCSKSTIKKHTILNCFCFCCCLQHVTVLESYHFSLPPIKERYKQHIKYTESTLPSAVL